MMPSQFRKANIKDNKDELLSKIRIIDNLFPDYDSKSIREKHEFESVLCNYYTGGKIGSDGLLVNFSSKLTLYADQALTKINYGRVKQTLSTVFLVSDNESPFRDVMHVDDSSPFENGYTLSYHFMGENNCGGTSFYQDYESDTPLLQVPFKENRLVVFPACIPHTGYTNAGYAYKSKRVIYTLFTILDM
jgi:hypothetical protein